MEKLQVWATRSALGLALFIPIFFIAAPLGYKFDIWGLMTSFSMLGKIGPKLLIGTAIIAALALLLSALAKRKKSVAMALVALAIPVAGLVHAKSLENSREGIPPIHDISTDTQDPPVFSSTIIDLRGETSNSLAYIGKTFGKDGNLVTAAQEKAYPDVKTMEVATNPDDAFNTALKIVDELGWKLQSQSKSIGIIEATDTTFWFGFKDDVAIRIRSSETGNTLVDIRSVSRVGRSDIGANAARIRTFVNKFNS